MVVYYGHCCKIILLILLLLKRIESACFSLWEEATCSNCKVSTLFFEELTLNEGQAFGHIFLFSLGFYHDLYFNQTLERILFE